MISFEQLEKISRTRLKDAKILLEAGSCDGALYLCGYAVELALKAIICKNLDLAGAPSASHIPNTSQEFTTISQIKTHKLDDLLNLSPVNVKVGVKSKFLAEWSMVQKWNPEIRYAPIRGRRMKTEAQNGFDAAKKILRYLRKQI